MFAIGVCTDSSTRGESYSQIQYFFVMMFIMFLNTKNVLNTQGLYLKLQIWFCFALYYTSTRVTVSLARFRTSDDFKGNAVCFLCWSVIVQIFWLIICVISFKHGFFSSVTETGSSFTCTLFLKLLCMENSPMRSLGSV